MNVQDYISEVSFFFLKYREGLVAVAGEDGFDGDGVQHHFEGFQGELVVVNNKHIFWHD